MGFPIQLTFRDFASSPWIEERVRDKALALSRLSDRILGCHVVIECRHHRHRKGNCYGVRLELAVPGSDVVVSREQRHGSQDLAVTLDEAFAAARRQLSDRHRRRRVSYHAPHVALTS